MSMSSEIAAGIEEDDLHFGKSPLVQAATVSSKSIPKANTEDITLTQRMVSACSGSLITSLVVTPFDVIRIRIQQQEILPSNKSCCGAEVQGGNLGGRNTLIKESPSSLSAVESSSPELFWLNKNYCKSSENCSRITSTFQGFASVSKNEGIVTLWRGLSLTLFMAIPSNIIYFTGYEYIRDHSPINYHPLNPLFCGSLARIMAATFVSPIELIKTRLQSIPSESKTNSKILSNLLKDSVLAVKQKGVGTLFTGLQLTLWRDVPFSGIYWLCYELFKTKFSSLLKVDFDNSNSAKNDDWKVFTTSFLSGSISGTFAAFFTNPFDVGKTRLQITSHEETKQGKILKKRSMFQFLLTIYKKEGIQALYSGFIPRVMKIAPSCAIMISSYEIGKKFFKKGSNRN